MCVQSMDFQDILQHIPPCQSRIILLYMTKFSGTWTTLHPGSYGGKTLGTRYTCLHSKKARMLLRHLLRLATYRDRGSVQFEGYIHEFMRIPKNIDTKNITEFRFILPWVA